MRENINLYKVFMRPQQVQLRLAFDLGKFSLWIKPVHRL